MPALHRKLLRDLVHLRGQVIAIILVLACGVATYVGMRNTYRSLYESQQDYYRRFRFAEVFAEVKRAPEVTAAAIRQVPGVAQIETRVMMDATLDVPGLDEPAVGRLISVPSRRVPMLNDLFLQSGRYVAPDADDEVIASQVFAKANHLVLGSQVQAIIQRRWKKLTIVGIALSPEFVYEIRGGGSILPDNRHFGVLWMSRDAMGPAFNMEGAFNSVSITLQRGASEPEVLSRVDRILDRYGCLGAYGRQDQLSHRFISDEIAQNRITATVIPAIFLAVAALLVHMVFTRLVSTQRAEVAIIRAFGYSGTAIAIHYLQLAMLTVAGGGLLGSAVGWYFGLKLMDVYAEYYHFPVLQYHQDPGVYWIAGLVTVGTGAAGAFQAVRRAMSLPPAEAMRPESPVRFHPMLLDRIGLVAGAPALRMIVRNLERRPWKAVFSTLALSCSIMIVVVEFGMFNAMDRMIEVQFQDIQREDAAISLIEPHSSSARFELARLPGVLDAEAFRAVPVRLRAGHRSRRTVLLGLENPSRLRRVVDQGRFSHPLPQSGLVITKALADILRVSPGDVITVEVLEGRRQVREVTLMGTADELLGTTAYMDIRALNRLLQEDRTISGAWVQVDAHSQAALYRELKQLPAVASVEIKKSALTSYRETIDRSLAISIWTLAIFAAIIAVGMIYNGARIALSERAAELATLRILGFSSREISVILLGEQGLLLLCALPFGFLAGYGICAALSMSLQSELYRIPLVVHASSYAWAAVVVFAAAVFSAVLIGRRLARLDLVVVLKSRE